MLPVLPDADWTNARLFVECKQAAKHKSAVLPSILLMYMNHLNHISDITNGWNSQNYFTVINSMLEPMYYFFPVTFLEELLCISSINSYKVGIIFFTYQRMRAN